MTHTLRSDHEPNSRVVPAALGFLAVALTFLVAMFCGAPAKAEITYKYNGKSFGPNGVGPGEFPPSAAGLAVDQNSGDVYVYDNEGAGNGTISKFSSTGAPVNFSALGSNIIKGVGTAPPNEAEIAVDSSSGPDAGDIYIANNSVVRIYGATGGFLGELSGGETCGVAVDSAGAVYVGIYPSTAKKYTPVTNPVTNADQTDSIAGLNEVCNVAVDGEGNFYAATYFGGITRYDALQFGSSAPFGTVIDKVGNILAVDPSTNDVFVERYGFIAQYDSSGILIADLGVGSLGDASKGVAIKSNGSLYAQDEETKRITILEPEVLPDATTETASNITTESATVSGTVNPNNAATTYQFEYGTTTAYGSAAPASPVSAGSDSTIHDVTANLTSLAESTTYHYRLVATSENGSKAGSDRTFHTTGPPAVDGQHASEIAHARAEVEAEINPGGFDTHYQVEYGTTQSYGSITASIDIGSQDSDQSASTELTGLQPGTTYHFRVVASNSHGSPVAGVDQTFTTFPITQIDGESFSGVGSLGANLNAQVDDFGLLSNYYYEYGTSDGYGFTTPETSLGAIDGNTGTPVLLTGLEPGTAYHFRVVIKNVMNNESSTVVGADATFTTLPISKTELPDGRVYEMVTPPNNQNANVYVPGNSADVAVPTGRPFQASLDGNTVAYVADPTSGGNGSNGGGGGNEYVATRSPAGWTQVNAQPAGDHTALYQAFTSDLSVGFLSACGTEPLSASAPGEGYPVLYSHAVGSGAYVPMITSTPPKRFPEEFGTAAVIEGSAGCHHLSYAGSSSDVSHILFEANDTLTPEGAAHPPAREEDDLYDSVAGQLNSVNVLPGASGEVDPNATFGSRWPVMGVDLNRVISTDGSRIFWTDLNTGNLYVREDSGRATARTVQVDAAVGGGGAYWEANSTGSLVFFTKANDLYIFDVDTGETTDLAPNGDVLGVVDVSEDGSYIYYVAEAALADGASAGRPNLYLKRADGSGWAPSVFIATLSPQDNNTQDASGKGVWSPVLNRRIAEATPNGHDLVFASHEELTGYNSVGLPEVYVYDSDTLKLTCASCSPSGEQPAGGELPLPTTANAHYMLRWISADGNRVFFNDSSPLVPDDSNGRQDVYEWERHGAGDCELSSGCLSLLSGGTSTADSYFVGTSLNGDDVFVVTRAQLLPADQNGNADLYDIRVGGARQPSPPACSGSGCQGVPPGQPIFATPSSVTFSGVGNFPPPAKAHVKRKSTRTRARRLATALKVCARKQGHKRELCRKLARKRYGVESSAKKSTTGRM
jgi:Fibronectin type III domain